VLKKTKGKLAEPYEGSLAVFFDLVLFWKKHVEFIGRYFLHNI